MKDTFVQLSEYIESLEQRIAALEARAAALESRALDADLRRKETEDQLRDALTQLAATAARIAMLETQGVQLPVSVQDDPGVEVEPEVEVELVVEDEPEPVVEDAPEPVVEENPESEPVVEQKPEPVVETVQIEKKQTPQQTSLFGTPVADIRQAISLGDRFLFQRELFGGNGELFQKMLDRLNAAANGEEALRIVEQQDWNKESSTYELFVNVIRRRFSEDF